MAWECEDLLHVKMSERFPGFSQLLWHTAQHYNRLLRPALLSSKGAGKGGALPQQQQLISGGSKMASLQYPSTTREDSGNAGAVSGDSGIAWDSQSQQPRGGSLKRRLPDDHGESSHRPPGAAEGPDLAHTKTATDHPGQGPFPRLLPKSGGWLSTMGLPHASGGLPPGLPRAPMQGQGHVRRHRLSHDGDDEMEEDGDLVLTQKRRPRIASRRVVIEEDEDEGGYNRMDHGDGEDKVQLVSNSGLGQQAASGKKAAPHHKQRPGGGEMDDFIVDDGSENNFSGGEERDGGQGAEENTAEGQESRHPMGRKQAVQVRRRDKARDEDFEYGSMSSLSSVGSDGEASVHSLGSPSVPGPQKIEAVTLNHPLREPISHAPLSKIKIKFRKRPPHLEDDAAGIASAKSHSRSDGPFQPESSCRVPMLHSKAEPPSKKVIRVKLKHQADSGLPLVDVEKTAPGPPIQMGIPNPTNSVGNGPGPVLSHTPRDTPREMPINQQLQGGDPPITDHGGARQALLPIIPQYDGGQDGESREAEPGFSPPPLDLRPPQLTLDLSQLMSPRLHPLQPQQVPDPRSGNAPAFTLALASSAPSSSPTLFLNHQSSILPVPSNSVPHPQVSQIPVPGPQKPPSATGGSVSLLQRLGISAQYLVASPTGARPPLPASEGVSVMPYLRHEENDPGNHRENQREHQSGGNDPTMVSRVFVLPP